MKVLLLVMSFWVFSDFAWAVSAVDTKKNILPFSYVLEDPHNQLTASQVVNELTSKRFSPFIDHKKYSYGYTNSTFWIYVDLENPSHKPIERYVGTMRPDPYIFNLYQQVNGVVVEERGGTSVPLKERSSLSRLHFFKITLAPESKQRFYFKLKTGLDVTLDLWNFNQVELFSKQSLLDLTHFFYFGTIFSLVTYTLFLSLALKNISFLLYGLFGLSIASSAFVYSGFLEYWGLDLFGLNSNQQARSFFAVSPILTTLYTICFLKLKKRAKLLYRIFQGILCLTSTLFIVTLFSNAAVVGNFIVLSLTLSLLAAFFAACWEIYRGRSNAAIYYALGMFIFIVTLMVWSLGNYGIIQKNYYIAFFPLFGSALELLFAVIALSWQFKEYQEIQFAKEMSEAETNSLRTLVQVVCHDIANPLSIISISKKIATKYTTGHENLEKIFERISRASKSIESIIHQVRRMQAIKTGKLAIQLEEVDIDKVFSEVKFNLEGRAKQKSITLKFNIERQLNEKFSVWAEPTSLTHDVLCNFVSNAIKFSYEGSVINIKAFSVGDKACIEVEDQGVGVPGDVIKNIFSSNKSTSRLGTHNEKGTGFGMPLAKYFIELYGGTVKVESQIANDHHEPHGTKVSAVLNHHKVA